MTVVTLTDGRQVASDSDEWRWECLARHVLHTPGLRHRREFVASWEDRHGTASADRLRGLMKQLHEAGQKAGVAA